jgi:hypothetical protein
MSQIARRRTAARDAGNCAAVGGEALIAWIATAGVGLALLGIWFERGGLRHRGPRRITPQPGSNRVQFARRPEIADLPAGSYKAVLVGAVAGGRPSAPISLRMRIRG